ncbi:MAG TPA: sigma-54 dependent transcriptional regulator, partial [Candidatus Krumholzibacteria bacterium]|nr:sigma-54 dependent transcriptional regulator [Candidatus Krumholzibacteria bacterium]
MAHILIVDDEARIGTLLAAELADAGHRAGAVTSAAAALAAVEKETPDIVITDLRMGEMDGVALLKELRRRFPSVDVVVMTAYASIETAIATMREGAWDYIIKPFRSEEVQLVVARLEEKRRLEGENRGLRAALAGGSAGEIIGASAAMAQVRHLVQSLARSDAAVMIRGESGTGKEVVARALHRASGRSTGPFIAVNCAAIPETLLESELFGYEKGAFTGAARSKPGQFRIADRGTLFLDEIGDLPLSLQAKLLRVLESGSFTPLGGVKETHVDVRLVSATHQALETEIAGGGFRQDLFYRLNVFPIVIPPLRDRREDIAELARYFLADWGRPPADLGDDALARLAAHDWPGNVRELRNVLERAVILRPGGRIGTADIMIAAAYPVSPAGTAAGTAGTLNLEQAERELIARALAAAASLPLDVVAPSGHDPTLDAPAALAA